MRINGLDYLAITKLDVLSGLEKKVKICTGYRYRGDIMEEFPASLKVLQESVPVFFGRNLGDIRFVHGGVGGNVAENLAHLNMPIFFVSIETVPSIK